MNVLIVSLMTILMFFFFNLLDELYLVGTESYDMPSALIYVFLQTPIVIATTYPIIILIGSVISIGNFNSNKELQIFQIGGFSPKKIMIFSLKIALVLFCLLFAFDDLTSGFMHNYSKEYRSVKLNQGLSRNLSDSFWLKRDKSFIFVGKNIDGKNFRDIKIFDISENNTLASIEYAPFGEIKNENLNLEIEQSNSFSKERNYFFIESNNQKYTKKIGLNQEQIDLVAIEPKILSMLGLINQIQFLRENEIRPDAFEVEFFSRLFKPIIFISMFVFAISFMFKMERSISIANRIFLGIFVGLFAQLVTKISIMTSLKFSLSPFLINLIPAMILLLLAVLFAKKKINF